MVASINRYIAVLSIAFLSFAALLLSARPAWAASLGLTAKCSFLTMTALRCDIPVLSSESNAEIEYVTMQCNSTGTAFTLAQFEILATPPNGTSEAAYQSAGNRESVAGVVNTAENVGIFVKVNTTPSALIELTPAPTGKTSCTVSVSATY
jgi:hypothetical protein